MHELCLVHISCISIAQAMSIGNKIKLFSFSSSELLFRWIVLPNYNTVPQRSRKFWFSFQEIGTNWDAKHLSKSNRLILLKCFQHQQQRFLSTRSAISLTCCRCSRPGRSLPLCFERVLCLLRTLSTNQNTWFRHDRGLLHSKLNVSAIEIWFR